LWTMTTSTPQLRAEITCRFKEEGDHTVFEREFTYEPASIWFWVLDLLLMRRHMERESRIALERLKELLADPASHV
jgi:hypothetical protein